MSLIRKFKKNQFGLEETSDSARQLKFESDDLRVVFDVDSIQSTLELA